MLTPDVDQSDRLPSGTGPGSDPDPLIYQQGNFREACESPPINKECNNQCCWVPLDTVISVLGSVFLGSNNLGSLWDSFSKLLSPLVTGLKGYRERVEERSSLKSH